MAPLPLYKLDYKYKILDFREPKRNKCVETNTLTIYHTPLRSHELKFFFHF